MTTDAPNPQSAPPDTKKRFPLAIAIVAGALLIGLIVVLALQMKNSKQDMLEVGAEIPDFSVTTFSGEHYQKSDLSGKIILLNFWSSWCASCDEEGAALEEVWQEVKNSGDIVFLGVNYVDTEKDSLAFLEKYGITFPNGPIWVRASQVCSRWKRYQKPISSVGMADWQPSRSVLSSQRMKSARHLK